MHELRAYVLTSIPPFHEISDDAIPYRLYYSVTLYVCELMDVANRKHIQKYSTWDTD